MLGSMIWLCILYVRIESLFVTDLCCFDGLQDRTTRMSKYPREIKIQFRPWMFSIKTSKKLLCTVLHGTNITTDSQSKHFVIILNHNANVKITDLFCLCLIRIDLHKRYIILIKFTVNNIRISFRYRTKYLQILPVGA